MYVVIAEELDGIADTVPKAGVTLEQAFAQICCRAGFDYHFEQEPDGWRLVLTDAERPECSPEPIVSTYVKRTDAYRDLMLQAVDGRLRGVAAVPVGELLRQRAQVARRQATE